MRLLREKYMNYKRILELEAAFCRPLNEAFVHVPLTPEQFAKLPAGDKQKYENFLKITPKRYSLKNRHINL